MRSGSGLEGLFMKPDKLTAYSVIQDGLIEEIKNERRRQDEKFGIENAYIPERWIVILTEEVGEVSTAIIDKDEQQYHDELVQVAAVALAALENQMRSKVAAEKMAELLRKGEETDGRTHNSSSIE